MTILQRAPTILLTAFEAFGGRSTNTSLEVARAVCCDSDLLIAGARVELLVLPVVRYRAPELVYGRCRKGWPDAVIMLGEAAERTRLSPERVAINLDDFAQPDNAGNQPRCAAIAEDGPVGYFSTLPLEAITDTLERRKIPAYISNSAGLYLCNHLFYSVMRFLEQEGKAAVPAGFVHLPCIEPLGENRDDRETTPLLQEALRSIIEVVAGHLSIAG